jgi:hypothetical protein
LWNEYTRTTAGSCNFALVPSILIAPIMTSATIASWADSGSIIRDTLDTCTVQVQENGASITYTVDMQRGVIISMVYSDQSYAMHQYFYGCQKGIYFLTKVTFGGDTSIQTNGGYEFYNIRINGEHYTRIANYLDMPQPSIAGSGRGNSMPIGTTVSIYDLLGRRVVIGNRIGRMDGACRSGGYSSGVYLLKDEKQGATANSTVIYR